MVSGFSRCGRKLIRRCLVGNWVLLPKAASKLNIPFVGELGTMKLRMLFNSSWSCIASEWRLCEWKAVGGSVGDGC